MRRGTGLDAARAGAWLLAATLLVSSIALGSLHTPVLAVVAVMAVSAAALLWFDAEPFAPRPAATLLVLVAIGLIVWTGLQIVPLPRALLAALAPDNADVWARSLSPLHEDGPEAAPISLDPLASRGQILRGLTYLAVLIGALRVARKREGVAFLERSLIVSTVTVAGAALIHPVLGARKIFGLYEPKDPLGYAVDHLGPLLNMNHLAAYVNIGLLVAFASLIERRPVAAPRPIAFVVVVLLASTTVWSWSRGGTATMLLGLLLVAVMVVGSARGGRVAAQLTLVLVSVSGVAIGLLSTFDTTREKFAANDLSKLRLAENVTALLRGHGVFGVGRGAFESTFPHVRTGTDYWVYTHPENVLLQWTTEWGVPVSALALGAILWALRPRTVLTRSRPPAGAWAALVAVGLQNLVDFSSEVPGVVVALAVCAAIVTGGSSGVASASVWMERLGAVWARRPRLIVAGLAGTTVVALLSTLPFVPDELYNEKRAYRDVGLDPLLSLEGFHSRARAALLRHPAEPYFPYVGGVRAAATREESVLPWAARALERSPVLGRVHLLLARSLYGRNASQARLEYRTACVQDAGLCNIDESLRLVRGFEEALELVPAGQRGVEALEHLAQRLGERLPSTVARLDRELVRRDPAQLGPVHRLSAAAIHDVREEAPWCTQEARRACVSDGLAAARRLQRALPDKCEGHALVAELRMLGGEVDAAFSDLESAVDQIGERSECGRRLVALAVRSGSNARIERTLDRLLKLGCESPYDCVQNLTYAAAVETERGGTRRALTLLKKAWERAPEREELLVDVAQRASNQGFHGEALEAYTKLSERHPEDARWREALAREKDAVTRGVYERRQ